MRKFTLFLMSLFLSLGAMAQDWTFEVIDIASNADQMLYTNAPCTNTQWGDQFTSWTVLFDDNANTFLHTEYAQNGKSEDGLDHYIRVDLGAGNEISAFKFDYTTRGGDAGYDFPQKFIIAGSNEVNGTYTEIGRIESGCPIGVARSYSSNVFTSETPYRYLRFMVTETNTDRKGEGVEHNYWHMGEFRLYKATPFTRTDYVHNTGKINRDDRGLTSFTITDGEKSLTVNSIQTSAQAPVYVDKSEDKLTTTQGATLKFTDFSYNGSWMHAYAYIDYNKDYEFTLTNNNNGEGEGEIVSYNYYNGNDITGATGDQGGAMSSEYNGSKTLPAFTLPTDLEPGEYRMRIKVDWNNLDADYGASDIAANGGCQCDITLVVEKSAANKAAKDELKAAIEELDAFLASISVGNCITQYSTSIDSPEEQIEGIRNFYKGINSETAISSIEECTGAVRAIKESYKENVFEDGKFYHIRSAFYENGYVYASVTDKNPSDDRNECNGICWETTTTPSNAAIWKCEIIDGETYFKSVYTASYMSGLLQYCPGILSETEKAPITLTALGDGQVKFLVNGEQAHAQSGDNQLFFVPWNEGDKDSPSAWYVEEATAGVQPHTLTVSAAGYATLMLGYNTTIPTIEGEDCGVFVATIDGECAVMNEIEGVLPANTAVIIKAAPGTYNFNYATGEATAIENNDLRGTLYDKYITEDAYVLGKDNNNVAYLGKVVYNVSTDTKNDGTEEAPKVTYEAWKNNAFKAYLPAPTNSQGVKSYSLRFEGEGTTGIENVEVENEVKTIFDLTGRRVEAITAPGIYIVNGKKVLVK